MANSSGKIVLSPWYYFTSLKKNRERNFNRLSALKKSEVVRILMPLSRQDEILLEASSKLRHRCGDKLFHAG